MRLWSLSPKYLDSKGLVALWREGLLAKNVLEGKTKGYKNHPQLERFKNSDNPIKQINFYLYEVYLEAKNRGYNFSADKVRGVEGVSEKISISKGQIDYEFKHLLAKLKVRDNNKYQELESLKIIEIHNIFKEVAGPVEKWEKISNND